MLRQLESYADDSAFREQWASVQKSSKEPLISHVLRENGITVAPSTLFDVQIKHFHEYKRQLLFALYIISSYIRIKDGAAKSFAPRTCIIGGKAGLFRPLLDELQNRDEYCLMADFDAYVAAQDKVSEAWCDPARWNRMSILNTARSGKFSSDRAIMDYARNIWNVKPQTE